MMPTSSVSPRFQVAVARNTNIWDKHCAYFYAGLFGLQEEGAVTVDFIPTEFDDENLVFVEVTDLASSQKKRICFDSHDKSYCFNQAALESHDYCFKRDYHLPDVLRLPHQLQSRVVPCGPVYGARLPFPKIASLLLKSCLKGPFHKPLGRNLKEQLQNFHIYINLATAAATETPPRAPRKLEVLYQTRLWTDEDVTGSPTASEINAERVAMVRALKKAFKGRFVGGLVPTEYARVNYPDLLAEGSSSRQGYLTKMRGALVGIYTSGLHHSVAWKLAEYLANSSCIVSEPIRNTLSVPLTEANALFFKDAESCVACCDRLLSTPALAAAMQEENFRYYCKEARPSSSIWNCLQYAFQAASTSKDVSI